MTVASEELKPLCAAVSRTQRATGVLTTACRYKEIHATRKTPSGEGA